MIKPKLALIPSSYKGGSPKGTLYSVLPSDGAGDFDFERAGEATRINKDGLIETVDSNVPRLNYPLIDGIVSGCPSLLLEPESRNLLTYSEDFTQSVWSDLRVSLTSNNAISPDGTLNASELTLDATNDSHTLIHSTMTGLSANANHTISVFVKSNGNDKVALRDASVGNYISVDLSNGVILDENNISSSVKEFSNGWYRISLTFLSSSGGEIRPSLYLLEDGYSSGSPSSAFLGDGVSGVYIWGFQAEVGSYPTSYIPTNGEVNGVTRSAETCNNSGDVNTFNDSEGVLMAEISALNDTVDGYTTINVGSNSIDNRLGFGFDDQSRIYGFKRTTTSWNIPIEANINEFNKVAISYDTNNNHFWFNGFKVGSNTTIGDIAQPIELDFRASYGGEQFNGSTKQIQYFDTALNDTDLEELTSWRSFNEMAKDLLYTIL